MQVGDFNLSKVLAGRTGITSLPQLNTMWLAPECMERKACNHASDVYSFAMIMWEVLTGNEPWEGLIDPYQVCSIGSMAGGLAQACTCAHPCQPKHMQ